MPSASLVSRVRFVPATGPAAREGLLGWVSFATTDGLLVDGLALRLSRDGRHSFVWPARRDRAGRDHHVVRPLDDAARVAIEQQLLAQIGQLVSQPANALAVPVEPERHQTHGRRGEPRGNQR